MWGVLQFYPTAPSVYFGMLETVVLQCLARTRSKEEVFGKNDRRRQTYGSDELFSLRTRIEEAVAAPTGRLVAPFFAGGVTSGVADEAVLGHMPIARAAPLYPHTIQPSPPKKRKQDTNPL